MFSIKTVGNSGQISLGKKFAGQTVMIDEIKAGVWIVKLGRFIPDDEKWTYIHDGEKEQLDHILLSKFAFDRLVASGVTRIDNNVSDHDAIWATIDLTQ